METDDVKSEAREGQEEKKEPGRARGETKKQKRNRPRRARRRRKSQGGPEKKRYHEGQRTWKQRNKETKLNSTTTNHGRAKTKDNGKSLMEKERK